MRNSSAGEQRRFVAARAGADLEQDVLLVVRILRQQQDLELGAAARRAAAPERFSSSCASAAISASPPRASSCASLRCSSTTACTRGTARPAARSRPAPSRARGTCRHRHCTAGSAEQAGQLVVARFDGRELVEHHGVGLSLQIRLIPRLNRGCGRGRHPPDTGGRNATSSPSRDAGVHARVLGVDRAGDRPLDRAPCAG